MPGGMHQADPDIACLTGTIKMKDGPPADERVRGSEVCPVPAGSLVVGYLRINAVMTVEAVGEEYFLPFQGQFRRLYGSLSSVQLRAPVTGGKY